MLFTFHHNNFRNANFNFIIQVIKIDKVCYPIIMLRNVNIKQSNFTFFLERYKSLKNIGV